MITAEDIRRLRQTKGPAAAAQLVEAVRCFPPPPPSLMEFIPQSNRAYSSPRHLSPMISALERSWTTPTRRTIHAPPRHGKTMALLAFIALTLKYFPHLTLAYVTYEAGVARSKSRQARQIAVEAGVQLAKDASRQDEWRTVQGGGLLAKGIEGPLTSHGVNILLVDDPYKNRMQAESQAHQKMVSEWWSDVAETRLEPGSSAYITHTRWGEDDLIGTIRRNGDSRWENIHLPAISLENEALWPERWPLEDMLQKKAAVSPYTWASLYMGEPMPRDAQIFKGVTHYTTLPPHYKIAIGLDLAYAGKASSDWSVAVVIAESNNHWYVIDVIRKQVPTPVFVEELKRLVQRFPGAQMRWYCSPTEIGLADLLNHQGIPMHGLIAKAKKAIRAEPVALQWSRNKVMVPLNAPWLADFVREVTTFTGVEGGEDDSVDALAAAFDLLPGTTVFEVPARGTPERALYDEALLVEEARNRVFRSKLVEQGMNSQDPFLKLLRPK